MTLRLPALFLTLGTCAAALLVVTPQPARAAEPASAAASPNALFQAFGGEPGLQALSTDFVVRLKADAQIGRFFKDVKTKALAESLAQQFCQVLDGPCVYEGETMKKSHQDLNITRADFNRLVEVLQDAMNARGLAFTEQNRLLARLAPMHRDIVVTAPGAAAPSR